MKSGHSRIEVPCWRPLGLPSEEVNAFFLGGRSVLKTAGPIYKQAWEQRCHLITESSGTVVVELDVILRHFKENGVEW